MKRAAGILIIILALVVSGCTNKKVIEHHYTYRGENDLWQAEYKVDSRVTLSDDKGKITGSGDKESVLTVTYKNKLEDLAKVKHLDISFESSISAGAMEQKFDEEPPCETVYVLKLRTTGMEVENEEETIPVTIDVDGNVQTIELTSTR